MGRTIKILKKFSRFVLAGSFGTVVDTTVLWGLSHYVFRRYAGDYLLAPLMSFECAVFTNYCTAYFFVWHERTRRRGQFFRKYVWYNLSATGTFLVKMCFLLVLEGLFKWNVVICNLVALCISGTINFCIGEWVIFRKKNN